MKLPEIVLVLNNGKKIKIEKYFLENLFLFHGTNTTAQEVLFKKNLLAHNKMMFTQPW